MLKVKSKKILAVILSSAIFGGGLSSSVLASSRVTGATVGHITEQGKNPKVNPCYEKSTFECINIMQSVFKGVPGTLPEAGYTRSIADNKAFDITKYVQKMIEMPDKEVFVIGGLLGNGEVFENLRIGKIYEGDKDFEYAYQSLRDEISSMLVVEYMSSIDPSLKEAQVIAKFEKDPSSFEVLAETPAMDFSKRNPNSYGEKMTDNQAIEVATKLLNTLSKSGYVGVSDIFKNMSFNYLYKAFLDNYRDNPFKGRAIMEYAYAKKILSNRANQDASFGMDFGLRAINPMSVYRNKNSFISGYFEKDGIMKADEKELGKFYDLRYE